MNAERIKKYTAVLMGMFICLASLSGCGGGQTSSTAQETQAAAQKTGREASNEIAVGIAQDLTGSLDPYQMSTAGTREIMFNVFEGLYKPDSEGNIVPAVAESCEISEDGLTYTFTLRKGVKFHNGSEVTVTDVTDSFTRCAENTVDSNLKAALSGISSIAAGSDGKIIIRLEKANSDFMVYVASVYISPQGYDQQDSQPVGTGPFKFVSRSVQENIVLQQNELYYGEKAKVSRVVLKIYETEAALMTALNSGAVDMVAHLTSAQISSLSSEYTILEGTMNLIQALYLNNSYEPLQDVRVRQALCYAVDVDAMLALTADGHGSKVGSSIYPSFGKYFDESLVDAYPHDIEKAKALLKEAGYASGFDLVITVPGNYTNHVDTAVVLAEQLKEVGINASVQEVEWNSWLTDVYQGRNFQATVVGFDASTLTAGALLNRWVSTSGKNLCNFNSSEYDALIAEASSITDDTKRTELYRQAEKILSDEAANVYLQDMADFVALRSTLTGYEFYPLYVMDLSTISYR